MADVAAGVDLEQADDGAADDGAGDGVEATEDDDGEDLEADDADLAADADDVGEQDAADAAYGGITGTTSRIGEITVGPVATRSAPIRKETSHGAGIA